MLWFVWGRMLGACCPMRCAEWEVVCLIAFFATFFSPQALALPTSLPSPPHPPSPCLQTGSGKTHTLQGDLQEQDGLLPRSCRLLMEILREKVKGTNIFGAK